ncbi:augmenter of liver regeneration [Sodiomyces alkalinus F11]|uniref:Sulfhydryl oxidase n=1 Tax=Sodiomyces alkalinus (strain CBS 110278 / VKM F-3762 / F11) TaxID=1314773 RepID=A0A3N2Q7F3_SODAK|nr:augmenter of liver regeneration [Sodiomyces alkalinus F11]ROT42711.1 augmenter of liver regeneration [Sodiomyces alkalinus F11]
MALEGDDIRQSSTKPADPSENGSAEDSSKTLPKGVVIGKDGKPCRSCTSFAQWAAQAKSSLKAKTDSPITATQKTTTVSDVGTLPADCPPDVERLGNSTWTLLHTIAATYPEKPTGMQKDDLRGFMATFSRLYPCWVCAEDFQDYMKKDKLKVEGRKEFGNWLCEAHNEVNRKLGKKEFDCSKWEERWRTGWKDGRCD